MIGQNRVWMSSCIQHLERNIDFGRYPTILLKESPTLNFKAFKTFGDLSGSSLMSCEILKWGVRPLLRFEPRSKCSWNVLMSKFQKRNLKNSRIISSGQNLRSEHLQSFKMKSKSIRSKMSPITWGRIGPLGEILNQKVEVCLQPQLKRVVINATQLGTKGQNDFITRWK